MIFHLSSQWTIALDFIMWFFIHVGVSLSIARSRWPLFNPESWLYRERSWEKNGKMYDVIFRIKRWKRFLPDGAVIFWNGFRKKNLYSSDTRYIQSFIMETCQAELTHWIIFAFSIIFFLWNLWWVGMIMIAYAFVVNIPCVITQRYNRIRLRRVISNRLSADLPP